MRAAPAATEARELMRAAAKWLALMESGHVSEDDQARLQKWRNSSASHEHAWQRALLLRQRFSGLPTELAMAALDRPDMARRTAVKRALGVATLLPAAWLLGRELPVDVWRADLHTAKGEQQQLKLADGSNLQLNTDSAVNLDIAAGQLTLLRGEMSLKVPGSAPLNIDVPYGRVAVSRSEVCLRLDDHGCRVSVISGSAQLQSAQGAALVLNQGQQSSLLTAGFAPTERFDALLPGWREGVLMADDQLLGDFLRELSRYRPGLLRWDPALENLRVTGSFRLDDTDRVLSLLAASLPLEVQSRTRYWVTLVPKIAPQKKTA